MKARVRWVEGGAFMAESGSGHAIIVDGPDSVGGRDLGVRPMELMLLAVGSCSAVDILHILRKGRHEVAGCEVYVEGVRAETDPKVFTDIHLRFVVSGPALRLAVVERAAQLSAEKYCSASIMLGASARITHSVELHEAGG